MSNYLYTTDFLVPAGTALAAPLVQAIPLDNLVLNQLRIIIPDGHNGLTGVSVRSVAVNIVPFTQGSFLVGNNETIDYDWGGEIGAGQLQVWGFNTDIFDHTFHFRWQLSDIGPAATPITIVSPQAAPPAAADVSAILALDGSAPDLPPVDLAALAAAAGG